MSEKSLSAVVLLLVLGTGITVWKYVEGSCPGGPERCPRERGVDVPFDRDAFLGLAAAYRQAPVTPAVLPEALPEERGVPDGAILPAVYRPETDGAARPQPAVIREPAEPVEPAVRKPARTRRRTTTTSTSSVSPRAVSPRPARYGDPEAFTVEPTPTESEPTPVETCTSAPANAAQRDTVPPDHGTAGMMAPPEDH